MGFHARERLVHEMDFEATSPNLVGKSPANRRLTIVLAALRYADDDQVDLLAGGEGGDRLGVPSQ
jgi:hypothetical protein